MPDFDCVCADKQTGAAHFGAQNMSLPDGYLRRLRLARWLQIDVTASMALLMSAHAGIALDGNRDARVRLDMPYCIDEIAAVFGAI